MRCIYINMTAPSGEDIVDPVKSSSMDNGDQVRYRSQPFYGIPVNLNLVARGSGQAVYSVIPQDKPVRRAGSTNPLQTKYTVRNLMNMIRNKGSQEKADLRRAIGLSTNSKGSNDRSSADVSQTSCSLGMTSDVQHDQAITTQRRVVSSARSNTRSGPRQSSQKQTHLNGAVVHRPRPRKIVWDDTRKKFVEMPEPSPTNRWMPYLNQQRCSPQGPYNPGSFLHNPVRTPRKVVTKHFTLQSVEIGHFKVHMPIRTDSPDNDRLSVYVFKKLFVSEFKLYGHGARFNLSSDPICSVIIRFSNILAIQCVSDYITIQLAAEPTMFAGFKVKSNKLATEGAPDIDHNYDWTDGALKTQLVHQIRLGESQGYAFENLVRNCPSLSGKMMSKISAQPEFPYNPSSLTQAPYESYLHQPVFNNQESPWLQQPSLHPAAGSATNGHPEASSSRLISENPNTGLPGIGSLIGQTTPCSGFTTPVDKRISSTNNGYCELTSLCESAFRPLSSASTFCDLDGSFQATPPSNQPSMQVVSWGHLQPSIGDSIGAGSMGQNNMEFGNHIGFSGNHLSGFYDYRSYSKPTDSVQEPKLKSLTATDSPPEVDENNNTIITPMLHSNIVKDWSESFNDGRSHASRQLFPNMDEAMKQPTNSVADTSEVTPNCTKEQPQDDALLCHETLDLTPSASQQSSVISEETFLPSVEDDPACSLKDVDCSTAPSAHPTTDQFTGANVGDSAAEGIIPEWQTGSPFMEYREEDVFEADVISTPCDVTSVFASAMHTLDGPTGLDYDPYCVVDPSQYYTGPYWPSQHHNREAHLSEQYSGQSTSYGAHGFYNELQPNIEASQCNWFEHPAGFQ